jgi:uncharacterized membrane protein YidH (DUF202 family)
MMLAAVIILSGVSLYLIHKLHRLRIARVAAEKRRKREFYAQLAVAGITLVVVIACRTR